MYFLGIDLGTGGVRVIICDEQGSSKAGCSVALREAEVSNLPPGFHEQRVEAWWPAAVQAIVGALRQFKKAGASPREISAIGITSTSGTVVPLDERNQPLHTALMYNDGRAKLEAEELN